MFIKVILLLLAAAFLIVFLKSRRPKAAPQQPSLPPESEHDLLTKHVRFYRELPAADQEVFLRRVRHFLDHVAITPVGGVEVTALDRLYVAAAAIIPIAAFPDWAYNNLNEVLIYPGAFSKDFGSDPDNSNVLGMVGDGAMHRMMILSIGSLRAGFERQGAGNTGIHEFVHLLDKADGATDGIPEAMLPKELEGAWMQYMRRAIAEIRRGDSEINPYAGTNEAEFFAVISEYFFQKPKVLREEHPEIWKMMAQIYGGHHDM
jgi:Mlc titration factor MtfA (ptsG expression regulator)